MKSVVKPVGRALTAAAVLLTLHGIASATEIRCSSRDNKRRLCEVDTRGGVELVQRMSKSPCIENDSWGYDDRGIWVDHGCRAAFEVGGQNGSSGNGDAVGTIFGKIYGNQGSHNDSPERYNIPDWAVGAFRGNDPQFGQDELRIGSDGSIYAKGQRRQIEGDYFDGAMFLENTAYRLSQASGGFRADPVDGGEATYYKRMH